MHDFIDDEVRPLLKRHGLSEFSALWGMQLEAVDAPNIERGGWSSVARFELEGEAFYLKRQTNHLTRSWCHPFGEPTFAREFRAIQHYRALGIPALQAVYFAQRKQPDGTYAILITRALDGWTDLDAWLANWSELSEFERSSVVVACAQLAKTLHAKGQMHGCFYPKHIFLREDAAQGFVAQLIDLEKTRRILLGRRQRIKDLETLVRRTSRVWQQAEWRLFLENYLDDTTSVESWLQALQLRFKDKESRE